MSDDLTTAVAPRVARRVSMTVTGYLTGHLGGFYDLNSQPDGDGAAWSIPEFAVDEDSVEDAPPERLTDDDWTEIRGHVTARYGKDVGLRIVGEWRRIAADVDRERGAR
jgi:hypothetical protein